MAVWDQNQPGGAERGHAGPRSWFSEPTARRARSADRGVGTQAAPATSGFLATVNRFALLDDQVRVRGRARRTRGGGGVAIRIGRSGAWLLNHVIVDRRAPNRTAELFVDVAFTALGRAGDARHWRCVAGGSSAASCIADLQAEPRVVRLSQLVHVQGEAQTAGVAACCSRVSEPERVVCDAARAARVRGRKPAQCSGCARRCADLRRCCAWWRCCFCRGRSRSRIRQPSGSSRPRRPRCVDRV